MRKRNYIILSLIILLAFTVSSCTKERYFTDITGYGTSPISHIKTNEDVIIYVLISANSPYGYTRYFVWKIDDAEEVKTEAPSIVTKFTTAGEHWVDVWVEYENKDAFGNEFIFPIYVEEPE